MKKMEFVYTSSDMEKVSIKDIYNNIPKAVGKHSNEILANATSKELEIRIANKFGEEKFHKLFTVNGSVNEQDATFNTDTKPASLILSDKVKTSEKIFKSYLAKSERFELKVKLTF